MESADLKLIIGESIQEQIREAALRGAPLEACGLLAGRGCVVERFFELTNADRSADHYTMVPEEQFAAAKEIRKAGMELLAIWHSHPASPARMSAEDLRLAYTPQTAYCILSLAPGEGPALAAFRVDAGVVEPIRIESVL